MESATRELVWRRAGGRCEYCLLRQEHSQLTHPRRDRWMEHFFLQGARVEGLTPAGRATVFVLRMNDPRRLELRAELLQRDELS